MTKYFLKLNSSIIHGSTCIIIHNIIYVMIQYFTNKLYTWTWSTKIINTFFLSYTNLPLFKFCLSRLGPHEPRPKSGPAFRFKFWIYRPSTNLKVATPVLCHRNFPLWEHTIYIPIVGYLKNQIVHGGKRIS